MRRIITFFLVVGILLSMAAVPGIAVDDLSIVAEGACGTELIYQVIDNGADTYSLTISGTGEMDIVATPSPWNDYAESITSIIIEDGVTVLSAGAFSDCISLKTVDMAMSVETIPDDAFPVTDFELYGWLNHASGTYAQANDNVTLKLKQLRLLTIGNSHTDDYTAHFSTIFGDLGSVVGTQIIHEQVLYGGRRLIVDEGSTRSHYIAAREPSMPGHYDYINAFAKTWDMVLIQDYRESVQFGVEFVDELQTAVAWIREAVPGAKVGWVADWAEPITGYPYSNSIDTIKAVQQLTEDVPDFIIPLSTIVDNARSSYFGTTKNARNISAAAPTAYRFAILERDEKHMSLELGRYLIGVGILYHTFGYLGDSLILDENYDFFDALTTAPVYPDWAGEFIEDYRPVIEETVLNSYNAPLEITQSQYTVDPLDVKLEQIGDILEKVWVWPEDGEAYDMTVITDVVLQEINDATGLNVNAESFSVSIADGNYGVYVECSYGYSVASKPVLTKGFTGISDGYYYVDGIKTYGGLMHLDTDGDGTADAYYYANSSGKIVTGEYSVVKNNDLMPQGTYTFDETGKMVLKNGIVDGYWYVNNIKTYGGLMHLDTDGDGVADAYYYANSSGKIATGEYYITKTNDLLPKATYNFGEDGKLICTKHVWDEGVVTTEPTYTQTGEKTLTCVICGETKTEAVPKLVCTEHAWDDGVVTTEPTATKEGEKTFTCANCGETKTEAIPATGEEIGAIVRIAGSARYDTAFAAANTLKETLGVEQFSTIIVASGEQFADALAGSYLAAEKDAPILLVRDNKDTMKSVKDYIKENLAPGGTVYLLGGKNAVPVAMESDLEGFTVTRLAGADRYATNLEILKEAGVEGKDILVCTGKDFADSLSASAVGLPILLVKDNLNDAQKEFLQGTTGKKIIIGGSNAVSYKIEDQLGAYGEVIRLAGVSRYDTSVLVAETFFSEPTQVVVAFAENFPDGLSGGPVANAIGAPLILTKPGKESAAAEYVSRTGINGGYVLGGTAVLPEKTVNKVFGVQ